MYIDNIMSLWGLIPPWETSLMTSWITFRQFPKLSLSLNLKQRKKNNIFSSGKSKKIPSKLEVAPHALKMCEWVMGDTP